MEAQVQLDETRHRLCVVSRVPKGRHPVARHARPHDLVVMKGHFSWPECPCARLSDVVQQGGEAQ